MSLKSIDMQLALSRTNDSSALQNQLLHKPTDDQSALAENAQKTLEELRQKNTKVDEAIELHVKDEQGKNGKQSNNQRDRQKHKEREDPVRIEHPYKGHHIDLSL